MACLQPTGAKAYSDVMANLMFGRVHRTYAYYGVPNPGVAWSDIAVGVQRTLYLTC